MRNFRNKVEISIFQVKRFAYKAKKETFASNIEKVSLTDQTSVFSYRDFNDNEYRGMIYNDEFNGNIIEAGQETISIDLCNIWRNQYYGGMFLQHGKVDGARELMLSSLEIEYFSYIVFIFLKQALLHMPPEFPVRGPHYYHTTQVYYNGKAYCGNWEYKNDWGRIPIYDIEDPFAAFQGKESIRYNGNEVYRHIYHGGFLQDKYFPITLIE